MLTISYIYSSSLRLHYKGRKEVRSQRIGIFVSMVGGLGETAPYDLRTSACHRSRMKRFAVADGQKFAWVRL
jgi:hypothetical protein